ncbi:MAG: pilin [Betaproteobacteria bacterium]
MKNLPLRFGIRPRGYTLIHLLIVLAVIAIFAAMAMPLFGANVARQQILNSQALIDIAKNGVAVFYGKQAALPASNSVANLPAADKLIGNYVSSVEVNGGVITVTFGNNSHASITGKHLTIRPTVRQDKTGGIVWICAGKPVPLGSDVAGTNATDIPTAILPIDKNAGLECR